MSDSFRVPPRIALLGVTALAVTALVAGPVSCAGHRQPNTPRSNMVTVAEPTAPLSATEAFATVARVLRHPRCLNCHTVTDFPRVGDDGDPHRMNVRRGPDNHGPAGLQCSTCHQDRNQPEANVPGAPHWGLAPLSMGWEGLDDRQLAENLQNRAMNGDRSLEDLHHHVAHDPLVLWAWDAGAGREAPPVDHASFAEAFKAWVDGGAPLPPAGVTSY